MHEMAECLKAMALANGVDRQDVEDCRRGAVILREAQSKLIAIRTLLLTGWKVKAISHGAFLDIEIKMEEVARQVGKWQQWFQIKSGT
ncbi:hypothetical protein DB032_19505 [Chromobacterium sp. Panama]|uniref:hypothetical protein n=1 Tax=Chromobacterium sp. Panama TaxID=2161826 RepID=UPI000D31F767|nr:hypothetical protein [Chromobacterium sp. Panama]PTU66953.1 hypothetical protein DB032_19505 [Chromobacterium sp. Panama]